MQAMGILHNRLSQCISGNIPWCRNGIWEYPPIVEALSDAGIYPIGGYISTRPIFDLTVTEERRMRSPDTILLQEQEGMWFINEGRGAYESWVERE